MPATWASLPSELQIRILKYALVIYDERPRDKISVPQLNSRCFQIDRATRRLSLDVLEDDHYFIAFEMRLCGLCGENMKGYIHAYPRGQSRFLRGLWVTGALYRVSMVQVYVSCTGCGGALDIYPIWLFASEIVEALSMFQLACQSWNGMTNFRPRIAFTARIQSPRVSSRMLEYPAKLLNVISVNPATETIFDSQEDGIRRIEIRSTVPAGQPNRQQVLEIGSRWLTMLQDGSSNLLMHQLANAIEECCSRFDDLRERYDPWDPFMPSNPTEYFVKSAYFRLLSLYFASQANRLLQAPNTPEDQNFLSLVDYWGEKGLRSRIEQVQAMIHWRRRWTWDSDSEHVAAAYNVVKQRTELFLALARTASLSTKTDRDLLMRTMSWVRFCAQGLALMYVPGAAALKLKFDSKIRPMLNLSPPRGPHHWRICALKPYWWGKPPIELITRAKKGIAWNEQFSKEHPHLQKDFLMWRADIRIRIKTMELMIHESSQTKRPVP